MPTIYIEVTDTEHGVKVDVRGDLDGLSDAAFVARGMTVYAGALFVSAKPVLLGGDADPVPLPRHGTHPHDIARGQFAGGNFAGLSVGQFGGVDHE